MKNITAQPDGNPTQPAGQTAVAGKKLACDLKNEKLGRLTVSVLGSHSPGRLQLLGVGRTTCSTSCCRSKNAGGCPCT